jgi:ADP-heptose:LPS heptosyltransferase
MRAAYTDSKRRIVRRLLIRPGAIGDCLLCLPALEFLKADYTEVWIPRAVAPLVQFGDKTRALPDTGIDLAGLSNSPVDFALRTKLSQFDEVVSWYGTNRSDFRDAVSGMPCVFHQALPPKDCALHATDFFCSQVGASLGLSTKLIIEPAAKRDTIVIHPFSGSQSKNWPLAKFQELASQLPLPVEWTAGPEEELPEARRFAELAELAHWIAGARLYIGNDSGITHLAAAVGIPVITLFGPTDPSLWAPRGNKVVVMRSEPLRDLGVECVLELVRKMDF